MSTICERSILDTEMPDSFLALTFRFKSLVLKAIRAQGINVAPMEIKALHFVYRTKACTAAQLSEQTGRDKGQIARLIREMIAKELIEKLPNPNDTRSQLILLTHQGSEILSRMLEIEQVFLDKMRQNLTSEDIAIFNRVAVTMTTNLKE